MRVFVRTILVVLLLAALVLAWTNPDTSDFREFAEDHLEETVLQEMGDTRIGRLLAGAGRGLIGPYIEQITLRQSYLIYSTYTVPLTEREEDEWVFLGIGGQFVELQHPEVMRRAHRED